MNLLRAYGIIPFQGPPRSAEARRASAVAARLGVAEKTLKHRLQRLEAEGVIAGWEIYPNLRHFGLGWRAFHVRVPESRKAQAFDAVVNVDGVLLVEDFLGGHACVTVCFEDDAVLARRLRLLASILGDPHPTDFYAASLPPVPRSLTPLDWRIVRALRGNARRPLADVAQVVGVSARTVRRRYDRLLAEGHVDVVPMIDPGNIRGVIPVVLLFRFDGGNGGDAGRAVLRAFKDRYLDAWVPPERGRLGLALVTPVTRTADIAAVREEAAAVPGVVSVDAHVYVGARDVSGWLDAAIARAAGQVDAASVSGR